MWLALVSAAEPATVTSVAIDPAASGLEQAFSQRAGEPLTQFGYDLFAGADHPGTIRSVIAEGAVQDDYLLGIGDELQVTFHGQVSSNKRYRIASDGRLLVDQLRPVMAAGRRFDEVRRELEAAVAAGLIETDVFVSVAGLRRIGVLVAGEVARPGRYVLNSFATVLDALFAAGGIRRTGSLRRIQLSRPGAGMPAQTADLYRVLMPDLGRDDHDRAGPGADPRLVDGDRIVVLPLGPTAAVAGQVKRPAIYELRPDQPAPGLEQLTAFAGGTVRPGAIRAVRLAIDAAGHETTSELAVGDPTRFGDGDILLIHPAHENRLGAVRLEGYVHRPGPRALADTVTLSGLIGPDDPLADPYLPFAVLETIDPASRSRSLVALDLRRVLAGAGQDWPLSDRDVLIVLGPDDIAFLSSRPVLTLLTQRPADPVAGCAGLTVLARTLAADPDGPLARGPLARAAARLVPAETACPAVFDRYPDLLVFALNHAALITAGAVRPGFYPSAGAPDLGTLAAAAGRPPPPGPQDPASPWPSGAAARPRLASIAAGDGAIIESSEPWFELLGHVRHPGTRPLVRAPRLRAALAGDRELETGVYPLFGVVDRFDRHSLTRRLLPFSPREVVAGRRDLALADRDRIHVFSASEIHRLTDAAGTQPPIGLPRNGGAPGESPPASPPRSAEAAPPGQSGPDQPVDPAIAALLVERSVHLRGAVHRPGAYPVAEPAAVDDLIAAAGGLTREADPTSIEMTPATAGSPRAILDLSRPGSGRRLVAAGDALRVNPGFARLEARAVAVEGEVVRPGQYDVLRGETLSSLIRRAGGLTEQAFPAGAIFTRETARHAEAERYQRAAREIDRVLALEVLKGDPVKAEQTGLARQLAAELRAVEPIGRITVEADPAVLAARPALDILLEAGDRLVIPKRPLTVAVAGEVQSPAMLQFISGKGPTEYLSEAGGLTRNADDDRAFVIRPDGSAQPLAMSFWRHDPAQIPPGSTIVVPRDPHPFDFLELSRDLGLLFTQMAITAASLTVIGR